MTTVTNAEQDTNEIVKLGKTYTWMPSGTFFYDAARFNQFDIKAKLEGAIKKELSIKGCFYVEPDQNTDFYMGYIVILEQTLNDSDISKVIEKYPELEFSNINEKKFEQGILIISASQVKDRKKYGVIL